MNRSIIRGFREAAVAAPLALGGCGPLNALSDTLNAPSDADRRLIEARKLAYNNAQTGELCQNLVDAGYPARFMNQYGLAGCQVDLKSCEVYREALKYGVAAVMSPILLAAGEGEMRCGTIIEGKGMSNGEPKDATNCRVAVSCRATQLEQSPPVDHQDICWDVIRAVETTFFLRDHYADQSDMECSIEF